MAAADSPLLTTKSTLDFSEFYSDSPCKKIKIKTSIIRDDEQSNKNHRNSKSIIDENKNNNNNNNEDTDFDINNNNNYIDNKEIQSFIDFDKQNNKNNSRGIGGGGIIGDNATVGGSGSSGGSAFSAGNNRKKIMEKIDIIGKINGNFGRWQLRIVLLIYLCKIPSSWFMACIIFTAPAPRHGEFFCKPPQIPFNNKTTWIDGVKQNKSDWIQISHPFMEEKNDKEFNIDFCNVYEDAREHALKYYTSSSASTSASTSTSTSNDDENGTMTNQPWRKPNRNSSVIPCDQFLHHADHQSIITDFDLVCSRDILVATTQFFHLFGVLTGGILATNLLRFVSPRMVMLGGMLAQIVCGNLTGLVSSYELHVFFRCLSAVCCAQMYTAGAMIFTDITNGKPKTIIVTLFEQFWSVGVILLPAVAGFFKSWSHIYMAISLPTFILIILLKWIPNSPRWLIAHGRIDEAKDILIESATVNERLHLLPGDLDYLLHQQSENVRNEPPPAGWWSIWKGKRAVRHMICVHLAWSIYIVVYYGMLLNIRAFSREHLHVNTVIAGICEIIGVFCALTLILFTTRKWLWTGLFNIIAGCIAYTAWVIPETIEENERIALLMLSAMISKIAISSTLAILTCCTTELVCTEKKKICAFSTIVWARIWLLTAPFVGATIVFGQLIPQTAYASLAILGGLITMLIASPRTIPPKEKKSNLPSELTTPGIWTVKGGLADDKIKA